MAHFIGTVKGQRGEASRLGSKTSGLTTVAASWIGAVRVDLSERDGVTHALVKLAPWHGAGVDRILYDGPVNAGK